MLSDDQESLEFIKNPMLVYIFGELLFYYQLTLGIPDMKIRISFQVLSLISAVYGFLQYPFSANEMLGDFLESFQRDPSISLEHYVPGAECDRECKPNDVKVCRFHFMMKYFQVMGG